MTQQFTFLPRPTVAQAVYRVWLSFYRSEEYKDKRPSKIIEATADSLFLDYDITARIVNVQSRWNARKALRSTFAEVSE